MQGPVAHKAAILGGVLGTLSMLAMLGAIAFVLWRRSRPRELQEFDNNHRTGPFSYLKRHRTDERGGETGTPRLPPLAMSHTPIIEDNLIRMSLDHWARPFAHDDPFGDGEKFGLRITNPDHSLPPTPDERPDHPGRFLARQRSALAMALASFKRSASHQTLGRRTPTPQPSSPVIGDHLSQDLRIPPAVLLPRSTNTSRSSLILRQRSPEDPFLHPSSARRRPAIHPIQMIRSRTPSYSHIGSHMPARQASGNSSESNSSEAISFQHYEHRRNKSRSDPFQIDPRGRTAGPSPEEDTPNWRVHAYAGT